MQPLADAGCGREDGAEADGAFGHQHDDALRGVRQFARTGEYSRGTGYRRLTNATGNKQATGRKQGAMIRGDNRDKLFQIKGLFSGSSRQSDGFPIARSSSVTSYSGGWRLETAAPSLLVKATVRRHTNRRTRAGEKDSHLLSSAIRTATLSTRTLLCGTGYAPMLSRPGRSGCDSRITMFTSRPRAIRSRRSRSMEYSRKLPRNRRDTSG